MEYKTVPFNANISRGDGGDKAASQLESLIESNRSQGWEFYSLENVTTDVSPDNGCFGIGAKPGYSVSVQVAVFRK